MSIDAIGGDAAVADFRERLKRDRRAFGEMLARTTLTSADLNLIEVLAHQLAGAAGLFGYPEIGDAAADLEDVVIRNQRVGASARPPLRPRVTSFLSLIDEGLVRR